MVTQRDIRRKESRSRSAPSQRSIYETHPVGAENLCHQAILMDHASDAVAPPDADVVQVGDIIWQRAQRRGLVQGAVWTVRVVATRGRTW
jgi:hypothetical protein